MCGKPPKPPDLSSQADASVKIAEMNQQLAMEQLAFAREQDARNGEMLGQVLGIQLPIMEESFRQGMEDRQRYEEIFRPLEDQLVQDAERYMDPAFQEAEAARAMQDMAVNQEAQRENALRSLESYGIDPSVARHQSMDKSMRADQAAMQAFAGNQGRRDARNEGRQLQGMAIDIGQRQAQQGAQGMQAALGAGNAIMGNQGRQGQLTMQGFSGAQQGMTSALSGYGQSANIHNQSYQNQMAHHNASGQFGAALGGLAGAAMGAIGGPMGSVVGKGLGEKVMGGQAAGGVVPDDAAPVPQHGDVHPTMLAEGEYVVPEEVVRVKGTEYFDRLVQKYAPERMEQRQNVALPVGV